MSLENFLVLFLFWLILQPNFLIKKECVIKWGCLETKLDLHIFRNDHVITTLSLNDYLKVIKILDRLRKLAITLLDFLIFFSIRPLRVKLDYILNFTIAQLGLVRSCYLDIICYVHIIDNIS